MPDLPPRCVLVADDNPLSLRFFADALARLGFASVAATDGAFALAEAQRAPFDLLLLDARMPNLDGVQALQRIRSMPGPSQQATALATTADTNPAVETALRAAGFAEVLVKPIGLDALGIALARHLPAAQDAALDDAQALAATGGDRAILAALRGLFASELEALPDELTAIARRGDVAALRERLHRLDASAGFCGAPAVQLAAAHLRGALDDGAWPQAALDTFLVRCARVHALLAAAAPEAKPEA